MSLRFPLAAPARRPWRSCPAASVAFTLIELLVVVAIIGLLVAISMPSLSRRALTRSAVCRTHLRQLGECLASAMSDASSGGAKMRYCPEAWPAVPMDVCPGKGIFMCPEASGQGIPVLQAALAFVSNDALGTPEITLAEATTFRPPDPRATNLWMVRNESAGYTEYFYEDWPLPQGNDYDDASIRLHDGPPRCAEVLDQHSTPYTISLYHNGRPIVDDLRRHDGQRIYLPEESTDYAMNGRVGAHEVAPGTLVLVDFVKRLIADPGSDIQPELTASARHLGRLNYLCADQSVNTASAIELDPLVRPDIWWP